MHGSGLYNLGAIESVETSMELSALSGHRARGVT